MQCVTRTIFLVFAFKVAESDTVNAVLQTINQSWLTVWGHVPQVRQWHDASVRAWFVLVRGT